MIDIVFPDGNEKEFIDIAEKLGYKGLVFVYQDAAKFAEAKKFETKLKILAALVVDQKRVMSARQKSKLVFVKSTGDDRFAFEKSKPDIVFELEEAQKHDYIHQRASGLNHILCDLAKRNNIAIGFSFSSVLNSSGMLRAQIIGRMQQNISLCRKYKNKIVIASFARNPLEMRSPQDLMSFFVTIGMHQKEAIDGLSLF
ncbi:MAG: RNase P subunit p30 family protein [Candidatus Woesearchaeota archaeon]